VNAGENVTSVFPVIDNAGEENGGGEVGAEDKS